MSDDDLIVRAADCGIPISPAVIAADARKLLQRSEIHSPTTAQLAAARRAAIEGYLLSAKAMQADLA